MVRRFTMCQDVWAVLYYVPSLVLKWYSPARGSTRKQHYGWRTKRRSNVLPVCRAGAVEMVILVYPAHSRTKVTDFLNLPSKKLLKSRKNEDTSTTKNTPCKIFSACPQVGRKRNLTLENWNRWLCFFELVLKM